MCTESDYLEARDELDRVVAELTIGDFRRARTVAAKIAGLGEVEK